ncbi:MAG: hypothetical protein P4L31_06430 [Candidatus Babeliales bacterium]|nr:hypothetical protein [Candidatus Babeliales bacterium]
MNISQERLSKFKQELVPIIYLSMVQVWWSFNFPAFTRLAAPWSTMLSVIMSVVSIVLCIYIFTYADTYAPMFNLRYSPNLDRIGRIYRNIERISIMAIFFIIMFIVWYNDLYGMSNKNYAFCYANMIITFALMARAANRPKHIDSRRA